MKFKTLVYGPKERFVDEGMLGKGIYLTNTPALHHNGTTINAMVGLYKGITNFGQNDPDDEWIQNLKQCKLIEIILSKPLLNEKS